MALRNITVRGDEILTKKCKTIKAITPRIRELAEDMVETMKAADGVGIAAPQVGILRRYCVIDIGDGIIELINPVIVATEGEQLEQEGCLSYPGEYGITSRPQKVTVRAQDRFGNNITVTGEDLLARALCHEIDHLDGVIFKDRLVK